MSSIIFESVIFWAIITITFSAFGGCFYCVLGKKKIGVILLVAAIISIIVGYICIMKIQTDRKMVRQTILNLAAAIEQNDVERVISYLTFDAESTKQKARYHMGLAKIEWTKIRDFKIISINNYTSPPMAHVQFTGTVSGTTSGYFNGRFTIPVHFIDVELLKEDDGKWYVTERCEFKYQGYNGD